MQGKGETSGSASSFTTRFKLRVRALEARIPLPLKMLRIVRFLGVGLIGLLVDSSVFSILYAGGAGAPVSRAISLMVATLATWILNRIFTFETSGRSPGDELLRYAGVAVVVQGFNYAAFLILMQSTHERSPLLCLLISAVMTAAFSFAAQSIFTFANRPARRNFMQTISHTQRDGFERESNA